MRPFEYTSPATKEQAVGLLATNWGQAEILAGGTDLLSLMKDDVVHPKRLVNIKNISDMVGLKTEGGGIRIGALTTLGDLADNPDVKKNYPALADALNEAASPQIRNMATIGGNLCQRPRCWYFRGGFGLLPKNASGKDLVSDGENRYHAVLGNDGPAKFVSPSTVAPALIAYGASIRIVGPKGTREIPLEKFYLIPKSDAEREHDLRPNEIVSEILLPRPMAACAHYEIRQKAAFDWPVALAAVSLVKNGNSAAHVRVVLGCVAPVPWVSTEAAQVLEGKEISEDVAKAAADAALRDAKPLSHNAYKVQLAKVAVKRAILKAAEGAA
ncbi:MAG: xanthine dehydrogenase family protein subunit M [Acidobacteriaceae bacterium]|nr:xanthine dehydrogenase family protein subunit M [Acidobacteriaceae bacterium]